jgi:hypothetical protein
MKHFFIILLGLITFLSPAQDSLIRIKPATARWFLEQADRAQLYEEKDSLNQIRITNLESTVFLKDQIINTYKSDSSNFTRIIEVKDAQITLKDHQIKAQKKEIRKQKFHKVLLFIAVGLASILVVS